jgi:hypothetical protein
MARWSRFSARSQSSVKVEHALSHVFNQSLLNGRLTWGIYKLCIRPARSGPFLHAARANAVTL